MCYLQPEKRFVLALVLNVLVMCYYIMQTLSSPPASKIIIVNCKRLFSITKAILIESLSRAEMFRNPRGEMLEIQASPDHCMNYKHISCCLVFL